MASWRNLADALALGAGAFGRDGFESLTGHQLTNASKICIILAKMEKVKREPYIVGRGPYLGRKDLYEKAIVLRKEGLSYERIAEKLGDVSWSSVKNWVRHLGIDARGAQYEAAANLRIKSTEEAKSQSSIRNFLIRKRGNRCERCGLETWQGEKIVLEMDHTDGDKKNNKEENLKLLCPNCHSLTPTWRRRKRWNQPA